MDRRRRLQAAQGASVSLVARLAAFLQDRPDQWIDGRILGDVGGCYAWRTRLSQLRRPPWNLHIENRIRRIRSADGRRLFVRSEYRLGRP